MAGRGAIAFYISGHGFGHAARQIEIVNAVGALAGAPAIHIRTTAAAWLFERTVRVPCTIAPGPTDTGVVQIDSLRLDEAATIRDARAFHAPLEIRAAAEAAWLGRIGARLVVSDAPPLACAAAARAGVPSIVIANFTWDWIYEGYADRGAAVRDLVAALQEAYARARAGWRLPMWGGFETVPNLRDLPFVARRARHTRPQVRRLLQLPADQPLALVSFGGYGLPGLDLARLDCREAFGIVLTGRELTEPPPPGVLVVDEGQLYGLGLRYEDLVGAVDVVVTKPGYGIVSECVAHGVAVLYTPRGRFVEYDVLVREMPRYLRSAEIPHADLFSGRWGAALDRVLSQPMPSSRPRTDGAAVAAAALMDIVG